MMAKYKDIEYRLTRSDRKTASIYIERDGRVTLLVPESLTKKQIDDLLESKRRWIYTNLAEWRDLNATQVRREYLNGEGFLYLGRTYRLKLVESQQARLMLKDGHFCLRADAASDADGAFKKFYRAKSKQRIAERVAHYQARMGREPKALHILDLKHRWASCSTDGTLNFNWKCVMAPSTVLDYVVVHELAHLRYPNHTKAFWNQVDNILPNHQERKEWPRVNGAGMDL